MARWTVTRVARMHTRKRINIMSSANPMYWQEGVGDDDEGKKEEDDQQK